MNMNVGAWKHDCQNVKLLEVSSVHDGHDQTKLLLCLEGVRQRHNEAAVDLLKNALLHHRPLQERMRKASFKKHISREKLRLLFGGLRHIDDI